jgi:two-component system, chemotaxis family, chemotaxis protein CheY
MVDGIASLRVLVIEDNQHMRAIMSTILSGIGIREIIEATDGMQALRYLKEHPVDFALADFKMQPIDGVEFTRRVRNGEHTINPYLPIIMITGHSERWRVMEARDAGVTEFIAKPLTAKAVIDRVNAVIFRPRPFIKTPTFFGPDRRRRADPTYQGPWRRASDGGTTYALDDED